MPPDSEVPATTAHLTTRPHPSFQETRHRQEATAPSARARVERHRRRLLPPPWRRARPAWTQPHPARGALIGAHRPFDGTLAHCRAATRACATVLEAAVLCTHDGDDECLDGAPSIYSRSFSASLAGSWLAGGWTRRRIQWYFSYRPPLGSLEPLNPQPKARIQLSEQNAQDTC